MRGYGKLSLWVVDETSNSRYRLAEKGGGFRLAYDEQADTLTVRLDDETKNF